MQQASAQSTSKAGHGARGRKRRIAKACDGCRIKKIRCSGVRPVCIQCSVAGRPCVYQDFPDEIIKPRAKGQMASQSQRRENRVASVSPRQHDTVEGQGLARRHSSFIPDATRSQPFFFGGPCPASLLNSPGRDWLVSRLADSPAPPNIQSTLNDANAVYTAWQDPASKHRSVQHKRETLPPWPDTLKLVNRYFEEFNQSFPIFDHPSFLVLLGQHFAGAEIPHPAWWACINIVLAIALRRHVEREATHERDEQAIWSFVNNALDVTLEIMMCDVTLMSIQAMVALAWFYLGTRNPQPAFMFSTSALRLCHAIGLHEKAANDRNIPDTERYLYWTAVILETHVTFRSGRPTACNYEAIHKSLRNLLNQGETNNDSTSSIHLPNHYFKGATELAVLKLKITHQLYGEGAHHRTRDEFVSIAASLMDELEQWKANARLQPSATSLLQPTDPLKTTSSEVLYMIWLDCMIRSGFRVWHSTVTKAAPQGMNPDVDSEYHRVRQKVVEAARELCTSIGRIAPLRDNSFCWEIVHQPICSVLILVLEVCAQPRNMDVRDDLHAIDVALRWLTEMQPGEGKNYVNSTCIAVRMVLDLCKARQRTSDLASERTQAQAPFPPDSPEPRATDDAILSTHSHPVAVNHDELTYLDMNGSFDESMTIDDVNFSFEQLSQIDLPFPWNIQDYA